MLEVGGRLHADSLGSLKELVGGAVREQITRGSLESVGDVEAERWRQAQCTGKGFIRLLDCMGNTTTLDLEGWLAGWS